MTNPDIVPINPSWLEAIPQLPSPVNQKYMRMTAQVESGPEAAIFDGPTIQLEQILAFLRALNWLHWTSHWQVVGDASYGDHLLFERLYKSTVDEIDTLAEKLVATLGPDTVELTRQAETMSQWLKRWSGISCPFERSLIAENEFQTELSRMVIANSGKLSIGMDDFLRTLADAHETNIYLLKQRLRVVKVASAVIKHDRARRVAVRHALQKLAAQVGTDTATIYAISPEQLFHMFEEGEWTDLASNVWGDGDENMKSSLDDMSKIIRQHGGAVFETGGDGFWDVEIDGIEGQGYIAPYGQPK